MGKLTAKMVGQISDPGRYGDGAGLYLIVAPTGTKSWVQRVRIDGKRTDRGLGGIAKVTLSTARKAAEANRTSLKRGHNPFTKTSPAVAIVDTPAEAKTIPTFGYAVQAVYEANREEWGDNTAKRWLARMVQHCEALDGREVDGITRRELADILTPLRKEHHETARKVRQGLSKVFRWVRANDYRVDDPADDALGELVSKVKHVTQHRESLPYADVAGALHKVRFGYALRTTALAFEFLVLTAARTGEVRFANWREIDLDAGVWEIPTERMKGRRPHRVPLSEQSIAILRAVKWQPNPNAADEDIHQLVEATGYVFRMPNGKTLSENAFLNRCKKDNLDCTPHGFRSSFRGWAKAVHKARWESIELSLAHTVGTSVMQAYDHDDLLEERRELLQSWADHVSPSESPF